MRTGSCSSSWEWAANGQSFKDSRDTLSETLSFPISPRRNVQDNDVLYSVLNLGLTRKRVVWLQLSFSCDIRIKLKIELKKKEEERRKKKKKEEERRRKKKKEERRKKKEERRKKKERRKKEERRKKKKEKEEERRRKKKE